MELLRKLEALIQAGVEGGVAGERESIQPLDLVRQIEREIERNRRVFISDKTYVAHKMVIHLYPPTQARVEEYEALFNNTQFRKYLEEYISERGYELLDRIRIVIQCHQERLPEFGKRHCFVEFSWPQVGDDPGELTVVLDPANESRLLGVNPPQGEVPQEAWLEVLEGEAYNSRVRIARREFNIGRTENVLHASTSRVLRVNHLAFCRPGPKDLVNRSVSRQHARIVYRGNAFYLHDTGSQNGTSVERGGSTIFVPKSGRMADGIELKAGDILIFGSALVRFHLGPMPAAEERPV